MAIISVYAKDDRYFDKVLYRWEFPAPTFYDLQQGFLKRFGNIVPDYPRMYMRNRVHAAKNFTYFKDALNRSKTFKFIVEVVDYNGA